MDCEGTENGNESDGFAVLAGRVANVGRVLEKAIGCLVKSDKHVELSAGSACTGSCFQQLGDLLVILADAVHAIPKCILLETILGVEVR